MFKNAVLAHLNLPCPQFRQNISIKDVHLKSKTSFNRNVDLFVIAISCPHSVH